MTKNYILAIGTNHPYPGSLAGFSAELFTKAGFTLTVLRGVRLETAFEFEVNDQIFSNAMVVLWGKGRGVELAEPEGMIKQAEERCREIGQRVQRLEDPRRRDT